MANRFNLRIPTVPTPDQLIAPITGIERAVKNALLTPARMLGLPQPDIPGPAEIVEGIARQLPAPPRLN